MMFSTNILSTIQFATSVNKVHVLLPVIFSIVSFVLALSSLILVATTIEDDDDTAIKKMVISSGLMCMAFGIFLLHIRL